jgi:hypothetical protein
VERDWNHPSIIIWTVINESWGIDLTDPEQRAWLAKTYDFLRQLDPTRLVVGNSACRENYQVVTDVEDFHNYYDMPDHYRKWRSWVRNFSGRPDWAYAHVYPGYSHWRSFRNNPWKRLALPIAAEVRRSGDEPLVVSEFGNWGLPDLNKLYEFYGGEPWWFETGMEWGKGVVYPHGIQERFFAYHLERAFPSLEALIQASQLKQWTALKYEIEQIRMQENISGYVITEFTDVHWESNGLLDMCRNPKLAAREIHSVNAENVILPSCPRLSYWEGERCRVELSVSQFSPEDLHGSRIEWRLDRRPDLNGELENVNPRFAAIARAGWVEFRVPAVTSITPMQLQICWRRADGTQVACNSIELFFYPRPAGDALPLCLYAPELSSPLSKLGYRLAEAPQDADVAVILTLTDELRDYLLGGGFALWLAESKQSHQTYLRNLKIKPRRESIWEGDWVNSLTWINQDRLFSGLPIDGLANFAFADLTPEYVIDGLKPLDFAARVHAGLAVGWLHRAAGVVAETPLGRGNLLISTFQLSRFLDRHPMAAVLLKQMLKYLDPKKNKESR